MAERAHVLAHAGLSVFAVLSGCAGTVYETPNGKRDAQVTDARVPRDAGRGGGTGGGAMDAGSAPAVPATGPCSVPAEGALEDTSKPTSVVGSGTAASCTSAAFVAAVARGGVITFDCGPSPVTITLEQTAKVFNDKGPRVVIDGANKVTLSGGGKRRILYQNTCDQAQVFTSSHCDNQDTPQLTVQNLTFSGGNAKAEATHGGGGAIYASGGRLKVVNSRFVDNVCADTGPDVGGGAIRALQQYEDRPVYIVGSTFGGSDGAGNVCSNGGALSSIGVSYSVINSVLSYNRAIGNGANPSAAGTLGGGSGGAIYNDGNTFTLRICGATIEHNRANEGGGAIFFVSNDRSGSLFIEDSELGDNLSAKFETSPGIFYIGKEDDPAIIRSNIE